jgi:hypothetical protein
MESSRSAGFQPARGKNNEAGWKPALRIKIALGEFPVLPEALLFSNDSVLTEQYFEEQFVCRSASSTRRNPSKSSDGLDGVVGMGSKMVWFPSPDPR